MCLFCKTTSEFILYRRHRRKKGSSRRIFGGQDCFFYKNLSLRGRQSEVCIFNQINKTITFGSAVTYELKGFPSPFQLTHFKCAHSSQFINIYKWLTKQITLFCLLILSSPGPIHGKFSGETSKKETSEKIHLIGTFRTRVSSDFSLHQK